MTSPKLQSDLTDLLLSGARVLGVPIEETAAPRVMTHLRLVREWNSRINLTAVRDPRDMIILHFLDSLTVLKVLPSPAGLALLDVGTGPGFPGMVLKSACESLRLSVMDRDPGKIVFLKILAKSLGFSDVKFLNMALGVALTREFDQLYDVVVSRAFSSDQAALDSVSGLLPLSGLLVRMTGPSSADQDLSLPHFRVKDEWSGSLPFSDRYRRVILYERVR